jgi:hypothetical protein
MSNRTWTCVPCRKSFRRLSTVIALACPHCHQPCEYVHLKIRVPSPRRVKEWTAFWAAYRAEKALLDASYRGELRETVGCRCSKWYFTRDLERDERKETSRLAEKLGRIPSNITQRQIDLLLRFQLPIQPLQEWVAEEMIEVMRRDKKAEAGKLRFVLPSCLGSVELVDNIREQLVHEVLLNNG